MDEPKRTSAGGDGRRSDAMSGGKPLKIGVYDRPASADRPKAARIVLIAVVAVIVLLIAYFILGHRTAHSAEIGAAWLASAAAVHACSVEGRRGL
jgi:hypothetical protein